MTGFVYFVQAGEGGPVKIGTAADVASRLAELQTGNHELLSVLRTIEGNRAVERWLHRHYAPLVIRGEWFRFCATMLAIEPPTLVADPLDRPDAIAHAIKEAGGVAALARFIGISSQAISQWDRVPSERVLQVERATGGKISRHDLRPDLYPVESAEGTAA